MPSLSNPRFSGVSPVVAATAAVSISAARKARLFDLIRSRGYVITIERAKVLPRRAPSGWADSDRATDRANRPAPETRRDSRIRLARREGQALAPDQACPQRSQ